MTGIYIMSSEPQRGKTIAALGIMEALAGRVHRLSVFRPLVHAGDERDSLINLLSSRYSLQTTYEKMYGVNGAIPASPEQPAGPTLSGNNRSLVLRLAHGNIAMLFPGDLEQQGEELLLRKGSNIRANVLLAGHHGSRGSSSPPFIAAVNPELIIVSAGRNSKSGYLDQEHLAAWRQAGRTVLTTALDGTVTVRTDGRRMTVQAFAD